MNYIGEFANLYDKIFAKKNYLQEINFVRDVYNFFGALDLKNILDFGCGTGTHSYLLSQEVDADIVSFDISHDMISRANEKYGNSKKCTFHSDKNEILNYNNKFDLVISMFYVVNHIHKMSDLEEYFDIIASKIHKNGIFIFDCWNGIAALRDPPASTTRERYADSDVKIITGCTTKNDLLNSTVFMENSVKIYKQDNLINKFSYTLKHILWSPYVLSQFLEQRGFNILKIVKCYDINQEAKHDDYKIVYICEYKGKK